MFWTSITKIADGPREKLIQNFFFSRSRIPCATEIGYLRLAKALISSLLNEAFAVETSVPVRRPPTRVNLRQDLLSESSL
jgi:hypothetical protein